MKQLLPYQRELKISQQNYSVLQKELSELKDKLIKKNALIAILEKKIKLQQETIYQMFINGSVTNPKLRNLMKVGEEADSVVKEALQNIFNLKADEFLDLNSSVVNTKSEKIVEINKRQLKESLLDDFRSL